MAEDKKIRVSADLTPLQELRQGAQALLDDINNMEGRFRRLSGKTLDTIQAQIDLLKERNRVADESIQVNLYYTLLHPVRLIEPPQERNMVIQRFNPLVRSREKNWGYFGGSIQKPTEWYSTR